MNKIDNIYNKLKLMGFVLNKIDFRIDKEDIVNSLLGQCGINTHSIINDENHFNSKGNYIILNAMKNYGGKNFDIKNITSGFTSSFELNNHKYKVKWDVDDFDFTIIEPVNKALKKEEIPFRWIILNVYSIQLLYLPISVILKLNAQFELARLDNSELKGLHIDENNLQKEVVRYNYSAYYVIDNDKKKQKEISKDLIFKFDAESIDEYVDYKYIFNEIFELSKGKIIPEKISLKNTVNNHCDVTISLKSKIVKGVLTVDGWVDLTPLLDLINSVAKNLNLKERYFQLETFDQSVEIVFMTESNFKENL